MSDYDSLREAITKLIDYPLDEWQITQSSADKCFEYLTKYEVKNHPVPKMLIEDKGVTLTWETGDLKNYQHFLSDGSGTEFYYFWKNIG